LWTWRRREGGKNNGREKTMANKLKELTQAVDSHVKHSIGTSNKFIENFAFDLCSPYFVGVFAANRIPRRELKDRERFIIIVNLGEKKRASKGESRAQSPVGHFVVVCAEKKRIQYWDPYALPCLQPKVLDFIRRSGRQRTETNKLQIQDFNSVYCGFFCLMYAGYQARCMIGKPPRFKLRFYKSVQNLKRNDTKCVDYLKKLVDKVDKLE
jgi:hypothetical protein